MPLRSRLRRAFTRGSQDDPNLVAKSKTKPDPNVYQPGEKMPPLKYRRPVNPEHKAHLEAFSWAKAWRRRSGDSIYSPMGSRMPSRQHSIASFARRSRSLHRKSYASSLRSPSSLRTQSRGRGDRDDDGVDSGVGASVAGDDRPELVIEHSDEENDVLNVGLSRHPTDDPRRPRKSNSVHRGRSSSIKSGTSRPATSEHTQMSLSAAAASSPRSQPFSAEDLELALKKSNLEATKEESDRSGDHSPEERVPVQRPRERLIAFDDDKQVRRATSDASVADIS